MTRSRNLYYVFMSERASLAPAYMSIFGSHQRKTSWEDEYIYYFEKSVGNSVIDFPDKFGDMISNLATPIVWKFSFNLSQVLSLQVKSILFWGMKND